MPKYLITIPTKTADFNFERGDNLIDIGNHEYSYTTEGPDLTISGDTRCLSTLISLGITAKVERTPSPKTASLDAEDLDLRNSILSHNNQELRAKVSALNNNLIGTTISLDEALANAQTWYDRYCVAANARDAARAKLKSIHMITMDLNPEDEV